MLARIITTVLRADNFGYDGASHHFGSRRRYPQYWLNI
jgi:hypothetical protein